MSRAPADGGRRGEGYLEQDGACAGRFEDRAEDDEDQDEVGDDAGRAPEHAVLAVPGRTDDLDEIDPGMLQDRGQVAAQHGIEHEQHRYEHQGDAEGAPRQLQDDQQAEIAGDDVGGFEIEHALPQLIGRDPEPVDGDQEADQQDAVEYPVQRAPGCGPGRVFHRQRFDEQHDQTGNPDRAQPEHILVDQRQDDEIESQRRQQQCQSAPDSRAQQAEPVRRQTVLPDAPALSGRAKFRWAGNLARISHHGHGPRRIVQACPLLRTPARTFPAIRANRQGVT